MPQDSATPGTKTRPDSERSSTDAAPDTTDAWPSRGVRIAAGAAIGSAAIAAALLFAGKWGKGPVDAPVVSSKKTDRG